MGIDFSKGKISLDGKWYREENEVLMAKNESELVSNRRARHDYEILETYEAGIVLLGTEIKSLRNHGGTLQDAFVMIDKGEAWLKNVSIAPYAYGNMFNHEERRPRETPLA